jgi:hypothetical protein
VADVLDTGPPRRPVRPRRWVTTAGALVLAGVAALLAARSTSDRATAPPAPTTSAPAPRAAEEEGVLSVAVGTRAAYAVSGRCESTASPVCGYRLHRRELPDGRWRPLPWSVEPRRGIGLAPFVTVTGDEVVSLVSLIDPARILTSTDDGGTVTAHRIVRGPPVAALPADGVFVPDLCGGCENQVAVVEPATGRSRPLAVQPPLGGGTLRSADRVGSVVWVVAARPQGTTTAVSTDAGRTWQVRPVPGRTNPNQQLRVLAGRDGSAWLLFGSYLGGPPEQLAGVRRIDGPGGRWGELDRSGPQTLGSALAGQQGLLVVETNGTVWRRPAAGRFARLPEPGPYRPGDLAGGPGGVVAAVSPDDANRRTVLLSDDGGETWTTERVL